MTKRRGNIPFDEEMTIPGHTIANQRNTKQVAPVKHNAVHETEKTGKCACKMPHSCCWFRVLAHVERPELIHAAEIHNQDCFRS